MIRHKFNAKKCQSNGLKFDSKAERAYYHKLLNLQQLGEVVFFLRQVPLECGAGVKYYCDFLVFYADGTVKFIDVKGMRTQVFDIKKKIIESIYPIEIEIVKFK